jgi:hypothetical protein
MPIKSEIERRAPGFAGQSARKIFQSKWQFLLSFDTLAPGMAYIYLHRVGGSRKTRVDPDEITSIDPLDDGPGSFIHFKNKGGEIYTETLFVIACKEWQMRYLWPNVERLITAILGGIVGALLTLLSKGIIH